MVLDEILLPPQTEGSNKKSLILDLDETLVHSSFTPVENCDLILPVSLFDLKVEIDGSTCNVFVLKRPGVDEFI